MVWNKRRFIAITFQFSFTLCHLVGSSKQEWLQIKWYTSILVYADDVNKLGGSVITTSIKDNRESFVAASKETGLEVNADKTKYMVISRDQNSGRSHNIKIDNSSFERVEEFKYLGTTLTNQISIQAEIKSRMTSRNSCYRSVQNILSSSLISIYT